MSSTPFVFPDTFRPALLGWPMIFKAWAPVALLASFIAIESTTALGSDHTSQPLHDLLQGLIGSAADHNWSHTHHLMRKAGHFLGYGVLSLGFFRGWSLTMRNSIHYARCRLGSHGIAVGATFLVASLDEMHQAFLPNRTGKFSDVLLDTAGAATLQLLLFLALRAARVKDVCEGSREKPEEARSGSATMDAIAA